uniref:Periaxin n=1 Tax=Xiphophorus couchianus TaxID=32473 RepID=A0A3B5LCX4_9TELE
MPQLGIALPKVTTHESDLSLSKKGKDLTLPEVKGEIKDLEIEGTGSPTKLDVRAPGIKVETKDVEGSLSKFKMSPFKISRFGAATPNLSGEVSEASETHTLEYGPGTDVTIPDSDVKIKASEIDGRASKFKIPKFGISLPKLKGSETDTTQSQKVNVDVTLFKAEVKLLQVDGEKINFSSPVVLNETPELEIPTTKAEHHLDGQEEKMKRSKIGIKMPKIKGPEFQLGLSSKDTDVMDAEGKVDNKTKVEVPVPTDVSLGKAEILISSGKVEVGKPEVQTQPTVEGQGGKFKMPKFGITMPKVKGPEAKKEVKVKLTETKTDIKIPDANFEAPDVEQSPSKFNMPTFKLPKLGLGTSDKNAEGDDIDKNIPDEVLAVTIVAPMPKKEKEGSPSKFKMPTFKLPKFGLSVQSSTEKEPPLDKDLKTGEGQITTSGEILSTSLEAPRIDVKAPSVALKTTGTESEGRGRKFKLPSLGFSASQTKGPDTDISLPTTEVDVTAPEVKAPSVALKTTGTESEGRGRKFKLPSLGFSASQTKGPDTDISLPTTDVDISLPATDVHVTAPEVKAEIQLPEEKFNKSFEVEAKAPEFKGTRKETEGSPSKFKMPTFKMPRFGLSGQSSTAEVPPLDKDLKIPGGEMTMSEEVIVVSTEEPSVEIGDLSIESKKEGSEREGKGKRFKMPSLGFSATQAKVPDTDFSLKTGVDVTQPEIKAEVKFPDNELKRIETEIETKAPEFQVEAKDIEGSTSKFKMPTFKLPKFGLATQSETTGLEEVLTVTTEGPSVEIKGTSVDLRTEGSDLEGKGRKFKLPSLSFSVPQAKEPETDLSLRTDVDVKVPEVKAEIKLPNNKSVEVETKALETKDTKKSTEGSPSKFKMPNFKLPKFGLATQTSTGEVPPLDEDVKPVKGKLPTSEEIIVVTTEAPTIEIKGPLLELKTEGIDGEEKGKKFKLPIKAEVKLPGDENLIKTSTAIEIKGPEIKTVTKDTDGSPLEKDEEDGEPKNTAIETKTPEITVVSKDTDGSPSKFKMPTFKLPKFGLEVLTVTTEEPSIKIKGPSVDLRSSEIDDERKGSKFKLPSLGFSLSQSKGPDTNISLPKADVDVTAPEVKGQYYVK